MSRRSFPIKPVNRAMATGDPALYIGLPQTPWMKNVRMEQNSVKKRWGIYSQLTFDHNVYNIILYELSGGNRFTIYLTERDIAKQEAAGTFSYITPNYTTGTITNITNANPSVITGSGTSWLANIDANDHFILDADHTSTAEVDANWGRVASVDSDTQITLDAKYTGTVGALSNTYKIRNVVTIPSNERWTYAQVSDVLYMGNGSVRLHSWAGTGNAAPLVSSVPHKVRYIISYANRLICADCFSGATRLPYTFIWSKEGDATNWTDSTAGQADLIDSEGYIKGIGKTGNNIVFFKPDNIYVYGRTGQATNPFQLVTEKRGIGCIAPYSPSEFLGTTAWLGRDDFYVMDGDQPVSIGEQIRTKFFDIISDTEASRVFGIPNHRLTEIMWMANTTEGRYGFVYNYKYKEWYVNQFYHEITGWGKGAV